MTRTRGGLGADMFSTAASVRPVVGANQTTTSSQISETVRVPNDELSPNLGDGRDSGGSDLSLRSDNLDSVGELYTEDNFRQLVVAIEATPTFFGSLSELENHGERGLV